MARYMYTISNIKQITHVPVSLDRSVNEPLAASLQCAPSEETERTLHLRFAQQGQVRYLFYKIATQIATYETLDLKLESTRVRSRSRVMLVRD